MFVLSEIEPNTHAATFARATTIGNSRAGTHVVGVPTNQRSEDVCALAVPQERPDSGRCEGPHRAIAPFLQAADTVARAM